MIPESDQARSDGNETKRVAFVLEQALGHITHTKNLRAHVGDHAAAAGIEPIFIEIPFEPGRAARIPGWSNWTIRSGVRARRALKRQFPEAPPDALFIHTQVPAGLLGSWMKRIPTVVSLDATPRQYDEFGAAYAHQPGPSLVERLKHTHQRGVFQRARRLVTWSAWARNDLVASYDVDPDLVTVIHPGVDIERWRPTSKAPDASGVCEVLFVGGDLSRKGGDTLIAACARLRADPTIPEFVLHLVTGSDVENSDGVVVHHGLAPNSDELLARFASADVFCLPTRADCLALVLTEAAAVGLPLISTPVGGIPEFVFPGENGELIEPDDVDALATTLGGLLLDPTRRAEYGANARAVIVRDHDARVNAGRIVSVIADAIADADMPRTSTNVQRVGRTSRDGAISPGVPRA